MRHWLFVDSKIVILRTCLLTWLSLLSSHDVCRACVKKNQKKKKKTYSFDIAGRVFVMLFLFRISTFTSPTRHTRHPPSSDPD